jgi:hypothetical protein
VAAVLAAAVPYADPAGKRNSRRGMGRAVETDSWEYHRASVSFEDDHLRDLELRSQGITTRRYTGDQLEVAPERVAADLRPALVTKT